jgi:hypothetical protein
MEFNERENACFSNELEEVWKLEFSYIMTTG